jgi:hypothetical protein
MGLACAGANAQTVRRMEVGQVDGSPALLLAGEYGSTPYEPTSIVTVGDHEIGVVLNNPYIGYAVGSKWELTVPLQVPSANIYDIRICGGDVEVCTPEYQVAFLQSWVFPGVAIFGSSFEP